MHGVTTAIVAFILACLIFPKVVKNKPQYYAAVGLILLVILFDAIARMVNAAGFFKFVVLLTAVFQMAAIFLLILSAGGLTVKDLAGDLADTFEVIRRGGEEKEIIIPRTGEQPKPKRIPNPYDEDEGRPARIDLDAELRASHPPPPAAPPPAAKRPDDEGGIPLACPGHACRPPAHACRSPARIWRRALRRITIHSPPGGCAEHRA